MVRALGLVLDQIIPASCPIMFWECLGRLIQHLLSQKGGVLVRISTRCIAKVQSTWIPSMILSLNLVLGT